MPSEKADLSSRYQLKNMDAGCFAQVRRQKHNLSLNVQVDNDALDVNDSTQKQSDKRLRLYTDDLRRKEGLVKASMIHQSFNYLVVT